MSAYYSTNGGWHVFRLVADEKPTGYSGPYVVLDVEDGDSVERLRSDLINSGWIPDGDADALDDILRHFANPKPPRPDEPQGLGAVVEDADGVRWTRVESGEAETRNPWYPADCDKQPREWDRIAAVRVLSPGVVVDQ